MIEIDGVKFDAPDAVAELLRMVSLERDNLKAELDQCLTAHAELNDKCCALEDKNTALKNQLLSKHTH